MKKSFTNRIKPEIQAGTDRLDFEACFCSIFDECWTECWTTRHSDFGAAVPVEACQPSEDSFRE